jgi:hypothetical protein
MKNARLLAAILSFLVLSNSGCKTSGSKLEADNGQTTDETKPNTPKKISAEILLDFL